MYDPTFDFRYLKTRVSIDHVLAAYGLDSKLRQQGHCLIGPCPLHRGDNPTAFHVHRTRGIWRCFTSCGGGDIVDLIRVIERCSFSEAARILKRLADSPKPSLPAPAPQSHSFSPYKYHLPLTPHCAFLQKVKKISVSTALHYETGTTNRSPFLQGTVAVRLHDLCGLPLGYCGRYLNHKAIARWGKWRFPKNFPKNHILYNAHRALPTRNQGIVVVECPWAVMRLGQAGVNGTVALLGTTISPVQIAWLCESPFVLLLLDGDQAGRKASWAISNSLRSKTQVFIHHLPNDMEPEDLSDEELVSIVGAYLYSS